MKLRCKDVVIDLDRCAVMGVLNVTPDSFFDGGKFFDPDDAVARGVEMVREGAAILDVGGESSRPHAAPVPAQEELRRVIPVIEALAAQIDVPISIDTRKPGVARAAVAAGASVLNDTSGEDGGDDMASVAAGTGAATVIMHTRGTAETMTSLTHYRDPVGDVVRWLRARAEGLRAAGVDAEAIALDPGIGFAKTASQSLEQLRRLDELVQLGYPVLVGSSCKSLIGAVLGNSPEERLWGTAATVAWAVSHGARIVRVHDVKPMTQVVKMTEALGSGQL